MKKMISIFLLCAMTVSILAACAPAKPASTPAQGSSTAASVPAENALSGSITLMASQNWIKDVDRELFQAFQDETGVEVKVLLTPDNGYETLLGTSLAGGSNAVDMFMFAAGTPMISAGIPEVALDLSAEPWVANMEDWAKEVNSFDGKLVGFSTWGVDYEGVMYNKTLFEEKGWEIPNTWEGFLALCDTIQADGMMPMYEGLNGVWHAQTWLYSLTSKFIEEKPDYAAYLNESKDNKWSDIKAFNDGLAQIKDFFGKTPKYYTNDGQAEDWFGSYTALQNRDVAMMLTYTAYPAELAANGSTDEWGMFPLPLLDNTVAVANGGGISKYINKNGQNLEACKALCEFLARDENLEKFYAARTDLVTAAFKDVESVSGTNATKELLELSTAQSPVMCMKEVLYWDPDVYKYIQGFADGTMTVEQFANNMDNYRATMFDTAAE